MHLFLTGAVGCGKSTVLDKVLAQLAGPVGGFRTGFGPERGDPRRALCLWPAWGSPLHDEAHVVARFSGDCRPAPLPERFDALGCAALDCPDAAILVMDECGRLEGEALLFQAAVLKALDGDTPILGVVRHGLPGWTKAIAAHPRVEIVEVTPENRDALAQELLKKLRG